MKKLLFMMSMLFLLSFGMTGCSSDDDSSMSNNERKDISITRSEESLVHKNNDFSFRLLRTVQGEESQILSPLSITMVLGMLNNGATGETQQQINEVLGFGDTGIEAVNGFCRKLLTEAPSLDRKVKLQMANNIYVNQPYKLLPDFIKSAQDYYDATPETLNFRDDNTLSIINDWGKNHTNGVIPQILDQLDASAVSYLLSAVYFNGMWKDKFSKSETKKEAFVGIKGHHFVQMMHRDADYDYTENEYLQALGMPYGNGAFSMTVLLPRQNETLSDMLQKLDGEEWAEIQSFLKETSVDVKMPTFEVTTDVDLVDVMSKLGMPKAFSDMAEFTGFCTEPTYISKMKQSSRIKVDEEGTEAVSATVVVPGDYECINPNRAEFHATRPFIYVISEKSTGAIFFIGSYMGD